ncbi:MAG: cyclic peptide export ABC transporter [Bacillota bacterium]
MIKTDKAIIAVIITVLIFSFNILSFALDGNPAASQRKLIAEKDIDKIEKLIDKYMRKGKIPGLSIAIVNGKEDLYTKGFGYSDIDKKIPVGTETVFELGSTSKAFTGIGLLKLKNEGLISLKDPVNKYLPWFYMKYKNMKADITLEQLLHHTSGISSSTIGTIPQDNSVQALENTVKKLVGGELESYPGESYEYATINYDILGLIIQEVAKTSYEDYMREQVFLPLGLQNTFAQKDETVLRNLSNGYKLGFLFPFKYHAPQYRGNTPAGYIYSNTVDMARWLMLQIGVAERPKLFKNAFEESHIADRTVFPNFDGSSYAAGWCVLQSGEGEFFHDGSNPNYSSYLVFRPEEKLGVAVLANINTSLTSTIGQGVMDILMNRETVVNNNDMYRSIDIASSIITFVSIPLAILFVICICKLVVQIYRKKRRFTGDRVSVIKAVITTMLFMAGLSYCAYSIAGIFIDGLPWSFLKVWAPFSLLPGIYMMIITIFLFSTYYLLLSFFYRNEDNPFFAIAILSLGSGIGNAMIIFIISESIRRNHGFQKELFMFFLLGMAIYILGQKLVRTKLIVITNNMVYQKRETIINRILNSSYETIEAIDREKIYAGLNNDTEVVSDFASIVITGITSAITLVCYFIYLGFIDVYVLLLSIGIIAMAAALYYFVGSSANIIWEQARDYQDIFFKFINNLIDGFKELSMHNAKREEFGLDMKESCITYRDKRVLVEKRFADVFIIGELLFTFVIGAVVFLFPVIFRDISSISLSNYVFVYLYMAGPIHGILDSIPGMMQVRISWNRINELINCLDSGSAKLPYTDINESINRYKKLELRDVTYKYCNNNESQFSIGPINYSFHTGEIIFVTGGNGSGKSTLLKVITGLYKPTSGNLLINNEVIDSSQIGENCSVVFSDFHLFEKLYGIHEEDKSDNINKYLAALELKDKLQINDRVFNTIKLSTGQRKRIALLVSYLEDRSVYIFDEWAADQDPAFRRFFYEQLLPDLRGQGKCVIAATHDDRYFHIADKVIKLEIGKIVSS